jgi:hypothetical protein
MKITIEISDVVREAFLDNLMLDPAIMERFEPDEILLPIIKSYLSNSIDREDIDMYVAQYLDGLQESGELEDIMYELTLD